MPDFPMEPPRKINLSRRYQISMLVLGLVFLGLSLRAYELIFNSPLPVRNFSTTHNIRRGTIYDSRNLELAITRNTVSVAARPQEIINREETARKVAKLLKTSPAEVLKRLQENQKFVWISRKVVMDDLPDLQQIKIPGIIFQVEPSRYYPNGKLAAATLGFVGLDNEGLAGLEYQFNEQLSSAGKESIAGHNLYLTIDSFIQHQLEKTLREAMQKSKARAAVGIISRVENGEILALSSFPDFDPNNPLDYDENSYRNRAISEQYEPGSIFKIFTVASLLKEGLLDDRHEYLCKGLFEYKGIVIKDAEKHGRQTMKDIMKNSCNSGIIDASWSMPIQRFYKNLKFFGFGTDTGISLPGEKKGILHDPQNWDIYSKMSIPIGHGVSVTPIQITMAANAIANGGKMLSPVLVSRITTPEGDILETYPKAAEPRVEEKLNTEKILGYLAAAVSSGGTGQSAAIPFFATAGKTGTTIKSDKTGYLQGRYQASFIGFFPAEKPEVSIFIWFDEPQGEYHQGGKVAAPAFRQVLADILPVIHRGKISSTGPLERLSAPAGYSASIMPDLQGKSKKELLQILWQFYAGDHLINGSGYVKSQVPAAGQKIAPPYQFNIQLDFPGRPGGK